MDDGHWYAGNFKSPAIVSKMSFPERFGGSTATVFKIRLAAIITTFGSLNQSLQFNAALLLGRGAGAAGLDPPASGKAFGERGRGFSMNQVQNGCSDPLPVAGMFAPFVLCVTETGSAPERR